YFSARPRGVERDLQQTGAVSQVDKCDSTEIPDAMNPARNSYRFSCIVRPECTGKPIGTKNGCENVRLNHQFKDGIGIVKKTSDAGGRSRGRNRLNLNVTYIWWKEPRN